MKTVGIIGGLGSETTAEFYQEIVSAFSKRGEESHPPVLMYSVPLPLQLERECILQAQNERKCLPFLVDAAQILEKGGADFLVMPCNSLHLFIEEIRNSVQIPVLSAIEETVNVLKNNNNKTVGVLATSITINNGLYKNALGSNGIRYVVLGDIDQDKLGQIIYRLVTNKYDEGDKKELDEIINNLCKEDLDSIILACTDLQILNPYHDKVKILDTMRILLDATVREMIKK